MFKKSLKIFSGIILLSLIISVGLVLGRTFFYNNSVENIVNEDNSAEKDLIASNQEAIEAAKNIKKADIRVIDESDHMIGNINAPVKMVVYTDFECRFSDEYRNVIDKVKKDFADKVVIVYRHLPLISNANALSAAIASECASEQGDFFGMYELLFKNKKENKLNEEEYVKDALELGFDVNKFSQCVETEKYKDKIIQAKKEAEAYGIIGTPATFLNGRPIPGARPYEDYYTEEGELVLGIKSLIEEKLN